MRSFNIGFSIEDIEKYTESVLNIEGIDITDSSTLKTTEVNGVCVNMFNKVVEMLKAFLQNQDFIKYYEWGPKGTVGVRSRTITINNTPASKNLFNFFEKIGIPLSVLKFEISSDFKTLGFSNFILRSVERMSKTVQIQFIMYLVSLGWFISHLYTGDLKYEYCATTDKLEMSESNFHYLVSEMMFAFGKECSEYTTFTLSEINIEDYESILVLRNPYCIAKKPTGKILEGSSVKYLRGQIGERPAYLLKVNERTFTVWLKDTSYYIYVDSDICYVDMENTSVIQQLTELYHKTLRVVIASRKQFLGALPFKLLEDSDEDVFVNLLKEHVSDLTEGLDKKDFPDMVFDTTEYNPVFSIKDEYVDDAYAQELYKQVQPYYETFNLKELEGCLKGFVNPNGIYAMLLTGETGTGKSTAAKVIPTRCGMPFISVNFSTNIEESDIIGTMIPNPEKATADDPEFIWQDGILTKAVRNGYVFNAEEINFARPGVLSKLNSLLDEYRQIDLPTGEIVKAHKNFRIIATCNIAYEGTNRFNKALINRFQIVHMFKDLERLEVIKTVKERTGYTNVENVEKVYMVYAALKKFAKEQNIDLKVSIRQMLNIFTLGKYYKNAKLAVQDLMLNGAFIEEGEYKDFFEQTVLTSFDLAFKI